MKPRDMDAPNTHIPGPDAHACRVDMFTCVYTHRVPRHTGTHL